MIERIEGRKRNINGAGSSKSEEEEKDYYLSVIFEYSKKREKSAMQNGADVGQLFDNNIRQCLVVCIFL